MLQSLIRVSLQFRGIVLSLAALVLVYGFYVASHASLDVFPNFVPPQMTIQTEAPGLSAEQVETLVTRPVESAMNGLVSDQRSPMELRSFADWKLRPRLLAVSGVAKCSVFGGDVRQWQVQVDPNRLRAHDLTVSDVLTAARFATGVHGAGFVENDAQRIVLQTEGQALTASQLGKAIVSSGTQVSCSGHDCGVGQRRTDPLRLLRRSVREREL